MNYDRVILELLDRVSALEEIVAELKTNTTAKDNVLLDKVDDSASVFNGRDTTKYIFDGKRYGKNRLVLAVVQKYVHMTFKNIHELK